MAVVNIERVRKRVIELLLAGSRIARYTDVVSDQKRYAVLQEITDAVVEADMQVCLAVIETPGHPYRSTFMVPSSALASGDLIPAHVGGHGKVQIDGAGTGTYKDAKKAESIEELLEVLHHPTLYPNSKFWYYVEDNFIYHTGAGGAKVWYPSFTKNNAACQAHELYTAAVIAATIPLLQKKEDDASFFALYGAIAALAETHIRGGSEVIPSIEQMRAEVERGRAAR